MVKVSNSKRDQELIPTITCNKLENVLSDVCGLLPRSGGQHQYKLFIIIFNHHSKFVKLYLINRATTKRFSTSYHKNLEWKSANHYLLYLTMVHWGPKFGRINWARRESKCKMHISPCSNTTQQVLREVGWILRIYCNQQQNNWSEYIHAVKY